MKKHKREGTEGKNTLLKTKCEGGGKRKTEKGKASLRLKKKKGTGSKKNPTGEGYDGCLVRDWGYKQQQRGKRIKGRRGRARERKSGE